MRYRSACAPAPSGLESLKRPSLIIARRQRQPESTYKLFLR